MVKITEKKTKRDWAQFLKEIAREYQKADKITLVMDNLNAHTHLGIGAGSILLRSN